MAGANIKIGANSYEFQRQMKEVVNQLKVTQSQFSLASEKAKLFGNSTDQLKAKQSELANKLKAQNTIVALNRETIRQLNKEVFNYKNTNSDLAKKIADTEKKQKEAVATYGKGSKEVKELDNKLKELKEQYAKNEKAIENTNKKIDNNKVKLNENEKALLQTKKAIEENSKSLEKMGDKMAKAGEKAGQISEKMKPASVAMTGLGTAAAMTSIKFEDGLANINTLLDDQSHLDGYKNKIIEVSDETGKNIDIVTDGMYQAISSIGDGGKETERIFDTMAKSSKAGGAEVSDAVALISAGMKGYGSISNQTANQISDLAFQTAKLGVTTFPEMAKSMQPLFPLASGINLKMTELFGSMATLTGVTGNTSEVTTQLKAVFSNLMKPTKDMQKLIEKYGYSNAQAMIKAKGLGGVLKIVQKETGGQSDKMAKLFSSTEAMTAMTALCGNNFEDFKNKTNAMGKSVGITDNTLKKFNDTTGNDLRTSLNLAKNSLIGFGDVLAPFVSLGAKGLATIAKGFSGLTKGQKEAVVAFGATFVATNLLLGGFSKLTKGVKENIKFAKNMISTTKKSVTSIKNFGKGIKEGTNAVGRFGKSVVSGTKAVAKFTLELVKSVARGIGNFVKGISNGIKTLVKFTLEIIKNTAIAVKNGAVWVASKIKLLAYNTAQIAVTGATKAMTLAQKGLNLVLNMNPIGIVITLLTALATTFVVLYNKCEWFRNGVKKVWSVITSVFKGFANFFKVAFSRDWTQTFGLLGVPLNSFFGTVKSIVNGVKGVFNGVITFFKGVFTGNWRQAFQGLSNIVSSIFGTIGGIIKAPINAAISGINMAIRGVNTLSFDVPSWVPGIGGKHFGFNIPQIPFLAEGGIVTKATLAMVGEGKEHEAVIPLSKLDRLVTDSVKRAIKKSDNGNIFVIVENKTELDGEIIGSKTYKKIAKKLKGEEKSYKVTQGKRGAFTIG